MTDSLSQFCKALPKVELHAHLNGSLGHHTVRELQQLVGESTGIDRNSLKRWEIFLKDPDGYSLEECFQLFGMIQTLTSSPEMLYKATVDVIQDFANDGVVYLELRSTPREVPGVMTKLAYISTIAEAIRNTSCPNIMVKLIISIDRRQGKNAASENVYIAVLARTNFPGIIVGMDLSGDPNKGNIDDYIPVLLEARSFGFKITVHCAEVPNMQEIWKILNLRPDRIGHGTCIHPRFGGSDKLWLSFLDQRIPIGMSISQALADST